LNGEFFFSKIALGKTTVSLLYRKNRLSLYKIEFFSKKMPGWRKKKKEHFLKMPEKTLYFEFLVVK
jgi:hypothetical protein